MTVAHRLLRALTGAACVALLAGCVAGAERIGEVRIDEAVQHRVAAGMEYLQMDKPEEARQHFSRALELDPRSAPANNAMALLYRYEGDSVREEQHYKRALRIDSDYAVARNNYGILLYQRGDYRGAVREFERVANDPRYSGRGRAFENLGRSYQALGDNAQAEKAFQRALRLTRNPERSLLALTQLTQERGDLSLAKRYYDQYAANQQAPSAAGLLVGIRLAERRGADAERQTLTQRLEQDYPDSAELRALRSGRPGTAPGSSS